MLYVFFLISQCYKRYSLDFLCLLDIYTSVTDVTSVIAYII